MSFNSLTTFSLSLSFVALSNSFIKLLKSLPSLCFLNSLSSTSSINSTTYFYSHLHLHFHFHFLFHFPFHLLMVWIIFSFSFSLLSLLFLSSFSFSFSSSWLFDSNVLSVKIVPEKSLNKFNNSFCLGVLFLVLLFLRFLVRSMYLNLF